MVDLAVTTEVSALGENRAQCLPVDSGDHHSHEPYHPKIRGNGHGGKVRGMRGEGAHEEKLSVEESEYAG